MKPQFFDSPAEMREWLQANHESADELWVGLYKKGSGKSGISLEEAVDQGLCFGWIDSKGRRIDEESYMIRFTRRKERSQWSERNVARVEELREQGLMQEGGLRAFDRRST